jgi:allophanate hydrolase subunit 1
MSRYSWGADEHLFVELAEEMSLRANFRAMAIATKLRERRPDGLLDICPANASYQVRFDPDRLSRPPSWRRCCARSTTRSATRTASRWTRGSSRSRSSTTTHGRTRRS